MQEHLQLLTGGLAFKYVLRHRMVFPRLRGDFLFQALLEASFGQGRCQVRRRHETLLHAIDGIGQPAPGRGSGDVIAQRQDVQQLLTLRRVRGIAPVARFAQGAQHIGGNFDTVECRVRFERLSQQAGFSGVNAL